MEENAGWRSAERLLPLRFRAAEEGMEERGEEVRLRLGLPPTLVVGGRERMLSPSAVTREDLEEVLDRATGFSRYTAAESLSQGYVTAEGGCRIGVCGRFASGRDGGGHMAELSSLVIRIPRERGGLALPLLPRLTEEGRLLGTLVLSPPGGGKTTFLRDLVRTVSRGTEGLPGCRVALVDERGELAAMYRGRPQLDVGPRTDVLEGCPKARAIPMLLRAMGPEVIALDELAGEQDRQAVLSAAGCGVTLLATVHAGSMEELRGKAALHGLLGDVFQRAVEIRGRETREYRVEALP